ncbi:MAG: hypothetical protein L0322_20780, partial [Chloroflexi bacterium]|nr:hypothetical protein [Chloroflexota bacterium]
MNKKQNTLVAFQGEPGAYSEQAIRRHFGPEVTTLPCRAFAEIFEAIHHGRAGHGMLPVENSLAGTVVPAYDQLVDHDLRIQAEVTLAAPAAYPGPAPQARPAVDFWERVPAPTALLIPVAVGLAVLVGVTL